jgi:hypothetical protein
VVAHLSSVSLRELRQLAGLCGSEDEATEKFAVLWKEAEEVAKKEQELAARGRGEGRSRLRPEEFFPR